MALKGADPYQIEMLLKKRGNDLESIAGQVATGL
jgi:hypothetical protein